MYFLCQESLKDKMEEALMKMKKTELVDTLLRFNETLEGIVRLLSDYGYCPTSDGQVVRFVREIIEENERLKEERFSKTDYERVVAEKEDYKSRYFKTKEELEEVSGELDEVKSEKWQQHLKDTDSEISYLNEEIEKLRKYKEFVIWAEEEDDFEAFSQM